MDNGCCYYSKKKVVPITVTTQVIAPTIEPNEKPYGYIKLHAGKMLCLFVDRILSSN